MMDTGVAIPGSKKVVLSGRHNYSDVLLYITRSDIILFRVSPQEHLLPQRHHEHSSVTHTNCEVHGLLRRCQASVHHSTNSPDATASLVCPISAEVAGMYSGLFECLSCGKLLSSCVY